MFFLPRQFLLLIGCCLIISGLPAQPPCDDLIPEEQIGISIPCEQFTGTLCLPIPFSVWPDYELRINGADYNGSLNGCDFTSQFLVNYSSLPGQGASGPYFLDNWEVNGMTFSGLFPDVQALVDSMNVWDPTGNWVLNLDILSIQGGDPDADYSPLEITHQPSDIVSILNLNTSLVPLGTQVTLEAGVHLLEVEDSTNCIDSVLVAVSCLSSESLEINLPPGQQDTICLDTTELPGNWAAIENICPNASGEYSVVSIGPANCVFVSSVEPGQEFACLIACDDFGLCDTTFLQINVVSIGALPVAEDDSLFTLAGLSGSVNVLANDATNGSPIMLNVLAPPLNGSVALDPNGALSYQPDRGYCLEDGPDIMTYELCNPAGCDTARVHFLVDCSPIEVYNGFSPNGDGVNDFFHIEGIGQFPNSQLQIFNRWGTEVFRVTGYENDWNGQYKGKPLPTGTYFYQLDYGNGQSSSGYLSLRR